MSSALPQFRIVGKHSMRTYTKIIVGVSDMKVSDDPAATLATFSLGSCIGVAVFDPMARVGGLLHYMLPDAAINPNKAVENPYMFCNTGIPALFKAAYALGAQKRQMRIALVGGATILDQKGFFNIGNRNLMAARRMFHRNNALIEHQEVGGTTNRTVFLDVGSGELRIKVAGKGEYSAW